LRFWSERQDIWFQLKSDVAVAVANALKQANIEIPFPQRDLHLRSADLSSVDRQHLLAELPPKNTGANTHAATPVAVPADTPEP
jgi:small-conductance mechanosensitive channel